MMLEGPNIQDQTDLETIESDTALTISQLLLFNMVKHRSVAGSARHNTERETPLAIYLGLLVHAQTRSKELIDKLHKLGLSVSYDRVLSISAAMANSVCMMNEEQNIVCPPKLKKDMLTTASVDNIDHNPSARTAKDLFHGTAISLTQHPCENTPGTDQGIVVINPSVPKQKEILELSAQYTNLEPLTLKVKDYKAPAVQSSTKSFSELLDAEEESQYQWIKHVVELLCKEQLEKHDYLLWAAYHAFLQQQSSRSLAITALLPCRTFCSYDFTLHENNKKCSRVFKSWTGTSN